MTWKKKGSRILSILAIILIANSVYVYATPPACDQKEYFKNEGKVTEYYFNEGSGIITHDDSGDQKTGYLHGDTDWVSERDSNIYGTLSSIDAALSFDGDGDYVNVSYSTDFNVGSSQSSCAVSAWIKVAENSSDYMVICGIWSYNGLFPEEDENAYLEGWWLYLDEGHLGFGSLYGQVLRDEAYRFSIVDSDGVDLRDGYWHFVACEYRDYYYYLYIDPVIISPNCVEQSYNLIGSFGCASDSSSTGDNDFLIGCSWDTDIYDWSYYYFFEGVIDNLHVYQIYSDSPRMFGCGSSAYWSFDERHGSIINDRIDCDYMDPNVYGWNSYGELNGEYYFVPGVDKFQLQFGPTNDGYACIYDSPGIDLGGDMYIEFFFTRASGQIDIIESLLSKIDVTSGTIQDGYMIYLNNENRIIFKSYNGGTVSSLISPTNTISTGTTYHVWLWLFSNTMYMDIDLVNGQDVYASSSSWNGIGSTTNHLYFGAALDYPGNYCYYNGTLDEVIFSNL
jgi:hypothetical protein